MTEEPVWNDDTRRELRERLRSDIIGELRLAKRPPAEFLKYGCEAEIEHGCPASERDEFIQFVMDEFHRAENALESEKATWPAETDCDRLDRVERALLERGILLWQVSPCCDTCTRAEIPDRIDEINNRHPGFRDRVRGYAFFIEQNMPEELAESTMISVYMGYGWLAQEDAEVAPDDYVTRALGIAREVCGCLRDEGFEPDWNGDFARKIGISMNWQRRTMLA